MAAETGSSMMLLAVVALVIPAIYATVTHHREPEHIESISLDISIILILTYVASLVFQFRTHQRFFAPEDDAAAEATRETATDAWSVARSSLVLVAAAALTGLVSEFLVHAVDAAGNGAGPRARSSWAWWWWRSSATRPSTRPRCWWR